MIKTQEFSAAIGETYTTVRNVYGRPGREPRDPGPGDVDFQLGSHRRYVLADALAWRIVRKLTHLGMTWDEAAKIVKHERPADGALRDGIGDADFFAVWEFSTPQLHQFTGWRGKPTDFAEIIEGDIARHGQVASVRMVSLRTAYREAELLAEQAGFAFEGDEIIPLDEVGA